MSATDGIADQDALLGLPDQLWRVLAGRGCERAAIGFAVAMLTRSQLAGVVVGIVLFLGEQYPPAILRAIDVRRRWSRPSQVAGPQWYQFLPFSIGDSVLERRRVVGNRSSSLDRWRLARGPRHGVVGSLVVAAAGPRERAEIAG